jgi:hypothetical protein
MPSFRVEMNYLKVYCNLIRKAENRTPPEGYTEKHHTFPKSIFGNNSRLVALTAKEHYIAHTLLEKVCIYRYGVKHSRTRKMNYAHTMMGAMGKYNNSRLYESARIRKSEMGFSAEHRKKLSIAGSGELHWFYGKKHSPETIEKMRISSKNRSPEYLKKLSERGKNRKHTQETIEKIRISAKNRSAETKEKMSGENHQLSCWWRITFADGRSVEQCGLSNWAKENGYDCAATRRVSSGKSKTHKDIVKVEKLESKPT